MRKISIVMILSLFLTFANTHKSVGKEFKEETQKTMGMESNEDSKVTVFLKTGNSNPVMIKTEIKTIKNLLEYEGINITSQDRVSPHPDKILFDNMEINVVFVNRKLFTEKIYTPYSKVIKKDSNIPSGTKIILQEGKEGISERVIRVFYKNDLETSRGVISRKTLLKAQDEIIVMGTKKDATPEFINERGFAKNSSQFKIVEMKDMEATAYYPGPLSCAPYSDGYTYTGIRAGFGVAAVDPSFIPLGTSLYINGYGYAIAADIGSAIINEHIDLCFNTYMEAILFGRKKVKVYILKQV